MVQEGRWGYPWGGVDGSIKISNSSHDKGKGEAKVARENELSFFFLSLPCYPPSLSLPVVGVPFFTGAIFALLCIIVKLTVARHNLIKRTL